ncbi:TIGR03084 family metal-binding protein [Nocardioides sp. KR10-350]|uniref:TIGR03084 family metal-binding protein n=1 Tax=Nocardioides cheoyonin TaxID=3156615 RepID=UPI0032B59F87
MSLLDDVLGDLALEGLELREVVAGLGEAGWRTPTPAEGWDVATQIAHLAWTDEAATAAARATTGDKDGWDEIVTEALDDPEGYVDAEARALATLPSTDLLTTWDEGRTELAEALRAVPEGQRLPWFGPAMSPASMATARFMETWAHGLDVREALGHTYEPGDRIRHVCHLGVRARDFAYVVRQLDPPPEEFRVELTAPSGEVWTWGPEDAAQRVTGPAYDFARLVTQRIHRDDTDLTATGDEAPRWLTIAQAFAGPPGEGRPARG